MWRTVCKYIRRCRRCQQFKIAPRPFRKPLRVRNEEDPFGCIAIDFIVELPLTERGNKNILVISDMFTTSGPKHTRYHQKQQKQLRMHCSLLFVAMAYHEKSSQTKGPNLLTRSYHGCWIGWKLCIRRLRRTILKQTGR
jgi:hypothetical protein